MRACVRCGAEMQEGFTFTGGGGNVLRQKGLSLKAVYPKAALCPKCGEISLYVDEEDLKKFEK